MKITTNKGRNVTLTDEPYLVKSTFLFYPGAKIVLYVDSVNLWRLHEDTFGPEYVVDIWDLEEFTDVVDLINAVHAYAYNDGVERTRTSIKRALGL